MSYQMGRQFSSGMEGNFVHEAIDLQTNRTVAVKVCYFINQERKMQFENEVRAHQLLNHRPGICHMIAVQRNKKYGMIYMRKYSRDLLDTIQKTMFDEFECRDLFFRIMTGVKSMHDLNIAHRDIKPENIFLTADSEPYLGDFGTSVICPPTETVTGRAGTLVYSAPEILLGRRYNPFKADIYSLGILLHVLLTNRWPFTKDEQIEKDILKGRLHILKTRLTPLAVNLIEQMVAYEPVHRPTLNEVFNHPWMRISDETSEEFDVIMTEAQCTHSSRNSSSINNMSSCEETFGEESNRFRSRQSSYNNDTPTILSRGASRKTSMDDSSVNVPRTISESHDPSYSRKVGWKKKMIGSVRDFVRKKQKKRKSSRINSQLDIFMADIETTTTTTTTTTKTTSSSSNMNNSLPTK